MKEFLTSADLHPGQFYIYRKVAVGYPSLFRKNGTLFVDILPQLQPDVPFLVIENRPILIDATHCVHLILLIQGETIAYMRLPPVLQEFEKAETHED